MIVFCAVLSGIEDQANMELVAKEKEAWFRQFLEQSNDIPSHNTLSDVMGCLTPGVFAEAFLHWAQSALPNLSSEQICLDGKTLRGIKKRLLTRLVAVKANYVLALKDNHPQLYNDVSLWLNTEANKSCLPFMKGLTKTKPL